VGINKPHKNLGTLITAWGRVATTCPEAIASPEGGRTELVIAGRWDPRYGAIRDQATALGPGAPVRFLGPVDDADLPALYGGSALFAFPSRYEGFGLPPLEAMACGVPVIAARATSLPEVVGDAGLLVDPDDVGAWSAAIARVLREPALAVDLARRGRARARRFTWSETARRTMRIYERIARVGPVCCPNDAADV
jgi:glycosyltransferase involved in cell wall biosynthesis